MLDLNQIKQMLSEAAKPYDIIVGNVAWRNDFNTKVLEIPLAFMDKPIDLETSSIMSQIFLDLLDDKLNFDYMLDVCSMGAERELVSIEDIEANINNHVYVRLINPKAGIFEVYGELVKVLDNVIEISYKEKTRNKKVEIDLDNIKLIRLAVKL